MIHFAFVSAVLAGGTQLCDFCIEKINQSHYRPEVPRGFQEVKVPRLRENGTGQW